MRLRRASRVIARHRAAADLHLMRAESPMSRGGVTADGMFRAGVEKGRPISAGGGVAIVHRDSGQPILSVADADGDGALDGLSYATVDDDGKVVVQVTDLNRNGRRGVVLSGEFVELKRENNRLIIP